MSRKKHALQSLDFRVEELEFQVGILYEAVSKFEKKETTPEKIWINNDWRSI